MWPIRNQTLRLSIYLSYVLKQKMPVFKSLLRLSTVKSCRRIAILWQPSVAGHLLCSEEGVSETSAFQKKKILDSS